MEIKFGENITTATGAFNACANLKTLNASGVIAISLSFSACPLTAESAISIINCLKNYAGTENEFAHTITLHANTKTTLDALGAVSPNGNTWLEYANDKGWNT